jgi:iron-sulfur cluster assembly accessory protein
MSNNAIELTDSAVAKCSELISREGRDDLRLRVSVQPGGCSGLRYNLYFDTMLEEDDVISDYSTIEVVVDKMSLPYLEGAVIDYEDTIEKQGFVIDNPNAQDACACGDSFN